MATHLLQFELPLPPSLNRYYRRVGPRTLISREGRQYRKRVCALLASASAKPLNGRLEVVVHAFAPDRRRRDLDNAMKGLLDALQHAGAYHDDSQIDELVIRRGPVVPGGKVIVWITEKPCDIARTTRCSKRK